MASTKAPSLCAPGRRWPLVEKRRIVERTLRAGASGRKNFLFAGSDAGGERAAALYSLLGSAKLNGLNLEAFLCEVLARIAGHSINRIAELLPWNLKASEAMQITDSTETVALPA